MASFFVSRIDTEADRRIDEALARETDPTRRSRLESLKGKIAVANAKIAYQKYEAVIGAERWKKLAAKGARPQRLLWASTSTKNPKYSDTMYVEPLIGVGADLYVPARAHGCRMAGRGRGADRGDRHRHRHGRRRGSLRLILARDGRRRG